MRSSSLHCVGQQKGKIMSKFEIKMTMEDRKIQPVTIWLDVDADSEEEAHELAYQVIREACLDVVWCEEVEEGE